MNDRLRMIWPPILVGVLFLALWQLIVVVQDIKPYLLPAPSLIGENFFGNLPLMWSTALYTGTTALLGLASASSSAWPRPCWRLGSPSLTIWSRRLRQDWQPCPSLP